MQENLNNRSRPATAGNLYEDTVVTLPGVRFAFPKLVDPEKNQYGKDKYKVCILIDKNDTTAKTKLERAIVAARELGAAKLWGGKAPGTLSVPVKDGDTKDSAIFRGCWFIDASSTRRPKLMDKTRRLLDPAELRGGDRGVALLCFKAYDTSGNRGVACYVEGILKTHNSEMVDAEQAFADYFEGEADAKPDAGTRAAMEFLGL